MASAPKEPESTQRIASDLLHDIITLRTGIASEGRASYDGWKHQIARSRFAASALNFAQYLAFRRDDLRPLQRRLMALGLSSLGRAEGHVLANVDAVIAVLSRLASKSGPEPPFPSSHQFFRGERMLGRNVEEIFGTQASGRGFILVTLGPEAADDPDFILRLGRAGMDCVRINCAHDGRAVWERMIANVRKAESTIGRRIRILMDIAGPKVRLAATATPPDRGRLLVGDDILLCRDIALCPEGPGFKAACAPPQVLDGLKPGDPVSIDDGKLRGHVSREVSCGYLVHIEGGRQKGVKLQPERGINFPGVRLNLDPLTGQDLEDLDFIAEHADLAGYSFVETAEDVAMLQQELAKRRPDWRKLGLVAKIETPRAVKNLPEIIVRAAGQQPLAVMIARGDLAVELGFTRLAEMQEEILWLCEAAHIPSIWATQVLEGLVKKGVPSRGEMTDAAMAGRAECVMLNKGPNVLSAVATLDRLMRRMAEHQVKKTPMLRALHSWSEGDVP